MDPVTITVAEILAPAEGKKQGKVIDSTGKTWNVWADKLQLYHRGASYQINKFDAREFKGKTYYTIVNVAPVGNGPSSDPYRSTPSNKPTAPYSDAERAEDIFATSMAQKAIEFNGVKADDAATLTHILRTARVAWKNSKVPIRSKNDDMEGDEIPEF